MRGCCFPIRRLLLPVNCNIINARSVSVSFERIGFYLWGVFGKESYTGRSRHSSAGSTSTSVVKAQSGWATQAPDGKKAVLGAQLSADWRLNILCLAKGAATQIGIGMQTYGVDRLHRLKNGTSFRSFGWARAAHPQQTRLHWCRLDICSDLAGFSHNIKRVCLSRCAFFFLWRRTSELLLTRDIFWCFARRLCVIHCQCRLREANHTRNIGSNTEDIIPILSNV